MDSIHYIEKFSNLNTAKRLGQVAPHKAVMLLSVIDLIEEKHIKNNTFTLDERLEEKFLEIWKRYVGTNVLFKPVPATPFYHLNNESFWNLYSREGTKIERMTNTPSLGYLRNNGVLSMIDAELFSILKDSNERARMRTVLISTYLVRPKSQLRKVVPMVIGMLATKLWA